MEFFDGLRDALKALQDAIDNPRPDAYASPHELPALSFDQERRTIDGLDRFLRGES